MVSNAGARSVVPTGSDGTHRLPGPASSLSLPPDTCPELPRREGNIPHEASFLHECQVSEGGQLPGHGR